ncbi:MAG: restriction endonuclease subunit S [Actinobacteria bacterium]|nr:restriction endonuclease subunit S [Actinomycetota bacterium]
MIDGLRPYPAYKDSGVPWLGAVPEHWKVRRTKTILRERVEKGCPDEPLLAATQTKGVVRKELYENRTVLALKDLHLLKLVYAGDFVISLRSFQGGIEYAREQGIISPAYTVLYPMQRETHGFLACLFKSRPYIENLSLHVTGIRQGQNIDYEGLSRSRLPTPPLSEQVAIARFLDHADRRIRRYIRAKQKLIKLLEEQKQAIIHGAVTRGLDPGVRFKPSGVAWLGDVPEHWEVKRLKYVTPGITVGVVVNPSSYFVDDGVPMLLGNNVLPGRFKLASVRMISNESNRALIKSQLRAGDVVVVRVGAPGVAAVVPHELDGCNCASMIIVRRGSEALPRWIEHLFNSPVMRRQIDMVKYGAAQKQFNVGHAVEFLTVVPGIQEQQEIVDYLSRQTISLDLAVSRTEREISLLREYRTRLIADVVLGKLDVREAAARLPNEADELEPIDDSDQQLDEGTPDHDGDYGNAVDEVEL